MAQRHANLLKKARIRIGYDLEEFTCIAVNECAGIKPNFTAYEIKHWISEALGEAGTLDRWLSKQGYNCGSTGMSCQQFQQKVKETRLAWIDWMIDNHHVFDPQSK